MSLEQLYLMNGNDMVSEAIERIKKHEPTDGYILAFSGGKDSVVLKDLALKSGVNFESHYCLTGIDPPELVKFIKEFHSDVIFIKPLMSMWQGILIHGLPLRNRRWCCEVLKEHDGQKSTLLQGVRWAESPRRKARWSIFDNYCSNIKNKSGITEKYFCNPIVDWSDYDIWQYINMFKIPYCNLYDKGYKRIGCILCPFESGINLQREVDSYPKYVEAYKRAAARYYDKRKKKESNFTTIFSSSDDYFDWWLSRGTKYIKDDNLQTACF